MEASPRDIVYTAPAEDDGSAPVVLAKTEQRYGGIQWQRDDQAMLYESWYKTRNTRTWVSGRIDCGSSWGWKNLRRCEKGRTREIARVICLRGLPC